MKKQIRISDPIYIITVLHFEMETVKLALSPGSKRSFRIKNKMTVGWFHDLETAKQAVEKTGKTCAKLSPMNML